MNEDLDLDTPGVVVDTMKAAKDDPAVNYKYALDPEKSCGMCVHFRAPGTCQLVMGVVRSVDSCNLFEARPDGGRVRAELPAGSGWNGQAGLDQSPDNTVLGGTQEEPDGRPERDLPIEDAQVKGPGPVQSVLVPAKPQVPQVQAELVGQGKFGDPTGAPRVQSELAEANPNHDEKGRFTSGAGATGAKGSAAYKDHVTDGTGHPKGSTPTEKGGLKWKTQKATVQSGEYTKSEVPQHVSHDGRFTITPKGGMKYARSQGVRGDMHNRWIWSGFTLKDNHPNLPKWASPTEGHSTVAQAKRAAERRSKKYESAKPDRRLYNLVESVVEAMYCGCDESGKACSCSFTPKGKRTFMESRGIEAVQAEVNDAARTAQVILITEGLGNLRDKNYYTSDAVATAAKVFEGKQFYLDHPSSIDEESRPERSVRDLAGWFSNCKVGQVKDPDTGEPLAACFATLNFAESDPGNLALGQVKAALRYQKQYPGKKDVYCGISINAGGLSEPGEIDGIEVNVVHEIEDAFSADIVTKPARGGKFLALSESERTNLEKVEAGVSTFLGSLLRERLSVAA